MADCSEGGSYGVGGGGAASAEEQCDKVPSQSAESTQRISTPLAMTSVQMLRLELYAGVFNDLPAEKKKKKCYSSGMCKVSERVMHPEVSLNF